jgi:hypothetical protein
MHAGITKFRLLLLWGDLPEKVAFPACITALACATQAKFRDAGDDGKGDTPCQHRGNDDLGYPVPR